MKLLNSFGPNPRLVRMFAHEKGLVLDAQDFDLLAGENRAAPYLGKNPGGQMPALELDDGSVIAETVAIAVPTAAAAIIPPNSPAQVLPGLIAGASLRPPMERPAK